jgi:hypothetical protein
MLISALQFLFIFRCAYRIMSSYLIVINDIHKYLPYS